MSFKVGVRTKLGEDWVFNDIRWDTYEAAEKYAKGLFRRLVTIKEFTIVETNDPPNAREEFQ